MSQAKKLYYGVLKLTSGKLITHGLSFIILPILTRLYSPEAFGTLALYLSAVSILSIFASLNYDVGITAAESEEEATATLMGAWVCATIFCLILSLASFFMPLQVIASLGFEPLYEYRLLVPVGVWISSLFAALNYFILRTQKFGFMAKVGVAQSVTQAMTQLGSAAAKLFGVGLILGDLLKHFVAASAFAYSERKPIEKFMGQEKPENKIIQTLKKLSQFPKYGLPSDLIITLGVALPSIFISKVWDAKVLGYFLVAQKIYDIPMLLVGTPIGRVFLSEAIRLNQENPLAILAHYKTTTRKLFLLSVTLVPLTVIGFFYLSEPFLGKSWGESGAIAVAMLPLAMARFFTSPISQISAVIKKQDIEFYVSVLRLIIVVGLFGSFTFYAVELNKALLIYSIVSFAMYLIFYLVYFYLVKKHHYEVRQRGAQT